MQAPVIKPKEKVLGAQRIQVAAYYKQEYERGVPIRSLMRRTGRSYGFVHRILSESGVKFRKRGGVTRGAGALRKKT
ncbi:helix-turn-helix domain-containing protein [Streptomyces capparidis]